VITVDLTWGEVFQAGLIALMRMIKNLQVGAKERYGAQGISLDYNFNGCLGEIALAKWTDTFWSGSLGNYRAKDVGDRWQVRAASSPAGRLILHPEDSDDDQFVLALVPHESLPRVVLRGWTRGRDGKREEYWADPKTGRPAFFVPQEVLLAMEDLR
jgi:hypothetical protein